MDSVVLCYAIILGGGDSLVNTLNVRIEDVTLT